MSNPTDPTVPPIHGKATAASTTGAPAACPYSSSPYCQLITWKDPVQTGKVFASIIIALAVFKKGNPVNWFFHLAFIGLLAAGVAEYASKLITGQGLVSKYRPTPSKTCAQTFNEEVLPAFGQFAIKFEDKLQRIIYAQDTECTLKAAGLSYIIYKVTSWVSVFTIIATAVIVVFTVPAIYSQYKKEIDAIVAEYTKFIKTKSIEFTQDARKAAEPHLKTLIEKSGPVGAFLKSKFPTRTAGSTVGDSAAKFGTAADAVAEKASATTTGSSQFPNVPSSTLKSDVEAEAKAAHRNAASQF